jgi:CBS domain-containing protein
MSSTRRSKADDVVADWMTTAVATVGPKATLHELVETFKAAHARHVCVVDANGRLVGILAERDVSRVLPSAWQDGLVGAHAKIMATSRVERFMTPTPLVTHPQLALAAASKRMQYCRIGALPVVESGQLVGILTSADCLRARTREDPLHPPTEKNVPAGTSTRGDDARRLIASSFDERLRP